MNLKRVIVLAAMALVIVIALPAGSWAEPVNEFTPAGSSGNYGAAANWTEVGDPTDHHVPVEGERIVIKQGKTCNVNVTTATLFAIDVEADAVFDVLPENTANINADLQTSTVDGIIYLNREATGSAATLHIRNRHTFDGDGKIFGGLDDSHISIEFGDVTSDILIEGYLKITGLGFVNTGTVHAKYPGGIVVGGKILVNTINIEDDPTGLWKASLDSVLRLDGGGPDPEQLEGDFFLDDGTLEVYLPSFTTQGGLTCVNDATVDCSSLFSSQGVVGAPVVFLGTPGT